MSGQRAAIVLAAGKGKRMKSDKPKVLHELGGKPLIRIVLDTLAPVPLEQILVVIGFKGEMVQEALKGYEVDFAWQKEQLGTGHAVKMTAPQLRDFDGTTLVLLGDMPLLTLASINRLFETHERYGAAATCLSAVLEDPTGYGRVVREGETDLVKEIVEHKEADDQIRAIREVNTGTFCFDNQQLFAALEEVGNDNSQQEFYLPDTIKIMRSKGLPVAVVTADDPREGLGVNSVEQLGRLSRDMDDS
jgi:bifunctional UDP-N-acetylglucosamine pyrophosphorylase/glucosamine-1-phosphate N-acetyltransferase